jgi:Na+/melibiose symporter-like transporter
LIFIANAVGFILAAFFVHAIDKKLGRARTVMACDVVLLVGYIIVVVTPPFPVLVVS